MKPIRGIFNIFSILLGSLCSSIISRGLKLNLIVDRGFQANHSKIYQVNSHQCGKTPYQAIIKYIRRHRRKYFYSAIKNKINSDNPVISQFVAAKTLYKK